MEEEKRSKNYYEVLKWVENCINSCETYRQLVSCTKLIKNFNRIYSKHRSFNLNDVFNLFALKHYRLREISEKLNYEQV